MPVSIKLCFNRKGLYHRNYSGKTLQNPEQRRIWVQN